MQLLLQFDADPVETLKVFCLWSEDMHIVWICSSVVLPLFQKFNLIFYLSFYYQSVWIVGTFSTQLLQFYADLLKHYMCFVYVLEKCILFSI